MWAEVVAGLLLLLTSGCVHVPAMVPTAAAHTEVQRLSDTPAAPEFAAEARVVVSRTLAAQELQRAVDDRLRALADVAVEVPFLGAMHLRPTARVQSVDAERGTDCDGCLVLTIDVEGLLLPTDAPVTPVNWRGRLRGAVNVELQRRDDGVFVVIAPVRLPTNDSGWQIDVEVDGIGGLAPMVRDVAQRQLRRLVLDGDVQQLVLAQVPTTLAQQVRGLRGDARAGAVVFDLALVALHPGVVDDRSPIVDEGFAVIMPDDTLRGVANAVLLQDTEHLPAGWSVWSTALSVETDHFALGLEAWQNDPARPYALEAKGRFVIDDAHSFHVDVDTVQHAEASGFNPIDPVVRAAIEHEAVRTLEQATLAPTAIGNGRVMQLHSVVDRGAMIELRGDIVVPDAP